MRFIGRYWVSIPTVWGLFILEFLLTIAVLTLFGIADPNTYRTKLWQEGADHGWNSNPNEILYSYANHNPISTPLVWSSRLNTYNVVIAVLSMFFLLTKSTMMVMNVFPPFLSIWVHALLIGLYCYSAYAQASPDTTDPAHPQTGAPWYITKSCDVSSTGNIKGFCEQAKGAFALTIVMIALFTADLGWSLYSNFKGVKPPREDEGEYDEEYRPSIYDPNKAKGFSPVSPTEQHFEMRNIGATNEMIPGAYGGTVPYTPRTQAFHTLGGGKDLPLRQA